MNTHIRDNLSILKAPASAIYDGDEATDISLTSTTFIDLDATEGKFLHIITTNGGPVMICVRFSYGMSATLSIFVDIAVDGTRQGGTEGLIGNTQTATAQATDGYIMLVHWISGLSAGSHIFKVQARVGSGTATIYRKAGTSGGDIPAQFVAREVS